MRSRESLGREFLQLGKHDLIALVTLRLKARRHAQAVVQEIDEAAPGFTDVFFAFQFLEERLESGLSEDFPGEYELVMAYHPLPAKFEALFRRVSRGKLARVAATSLGELHLRLLNASFRVESELLFRRLPLADSALSRAANPLARMVFVEQDVLCLRSLACEEALLPRLREHCRDFRRGEEQRGEAARGRQRRLQNYLYGEHSPVTQIHLPAHEAGPIFEMLEEGRGEAKEEDEGEMRDCPDASQMDFQPACEAHEQLAALMQQLHVSSC